MKEKHEIAQEYLDYVQAMRETENFKGFTLSTKEQEVYDMALANIRKSLLPDVPKPRPWWRKLF